MDKALQSVLSWWEAAGVDVPEMSAAKSARKPAAQTPPQTQSQSQSPPDQPTRAATARPASPAPSAPQSAEAAKTAKTLEELKTLITGFNAGEISDHARQAVFARGNPDADVMVIGEAPGRDEDMAGKPFVGQAGQLLDKIFASIGLNEDTLYITNVVNWRPPNNRNPSKDEIALCKPFIDRHIELADPKLIVLVGGISMTAMTGMTGIMKNRGQWTDIEIGGKSIPALPLYHPAFLLRQPAMKKDCWRDILSLRERLAGL